MGLVIGYSEFKYVYHATYVRFAPHITSYISHNFILKYVSKYLFFYFSIKAYVVDIRSKRQSQCILTDSIIHNLTFIYRTSK